VEKIYLSAPAPKFTNRGTTNLFTKLLTDETRNHLFHKDIFLLPNSMRFIHSSSSTETTFKAHIPACSGSGIIWRYSTVSGIRIELDKEFLEWVVEVSGEDPSLESRKERF
jgi:hypothetical protein